MKSELKVMLKQLEKLSRWEPLLEKRMTTSIDGSWLHRNDVLSIVKDTIAMVEGFNNEED